MIGDGLVNELFSSTMDGGCFPLSYQITHPTNGKAPLMFLLNAALITISVLCMAALIFALMELYTNLRFNARRVIEYSPVLAIAVASIFTFSIFSVSALFLMVLT